MIRLSYDQIAGLFTGFASDSLISFERVKPHNQTEFRRQFTLPMSELLDEIRISMDEGHLYGGDMEIPLGALSIKLIGHHDGIFWTEPIQESEPQR
jgi:hypothetical protein